MIKNNSIALLALLAVFQMSCIGERKAKEEDTDTDFEASVAALEERKSKARAINEKLCSEFPEELVLKHNPDAKRIAIERVERIPGEFSLCKVKLFYGDKEHEFWEGQVAVYPSQQEDPFWQYNPREGGMNHPVEEFDGRAIYVGLTYQLLILKDGLIYNIAPPNNGSKTSTGKATKEILFDIARHYKL